MRSACVHNGRRPRCPVCVYHLIWCFAVPAVAGVSKQLEALAARKAQLGQRGEDLAARLRGLGTLPADAFERHKDKATKVGQGRVLPQLWPFAA
jgi:hypothetical protein